MIVNRLILVGLSLSELMILLADFSLFLSLLLFLLLKERDKVLKLLLAVLKLMVINGLGIKLAHLSNVELARQEELLLLVGVESSLLSVVEEVGLAVVPHFLLG